MTNREKRGRQPPRGSSRNPRLRGAGFEGPKAEAGAGPEALGRPGETRCNSNRGVTGGGRGRGVSGSAGGREDRGTGGGDTCPRPCHTLASPSVRQGEGRGGRWVEASEQPRRPGVQTEPTRRARGPQGPPADRGGARASAGRGGMQQVAVGTRQQAHETGGRKSRACGGKGGAG